MNRFLISLLLLSCVQSVLGVDSQKKSTKKFFQSKSKKQKSLKPTRVQPPRKCKKQSQTYAFKWGTSRPMPDEVKEKLENQKPYKSLFTFISEPSDPNDPYQ